MHHLNLLETIAVSLSVAFLGGVIFQRLHLPTIVGYLLAGIALGPFTPGYAADAETINQLAELGIIFTGFVVFGKFLVSSAWVLPFPRPAHTALVVAAGPCQIGEFSFIRTQPV
jgi:CPA2 family monovalent cation:H+ antiporter-2